MKKLYEDVKKVFESKISDGILYTVCIAVIAVLIFLAGVMVGFNKASYSRAWGDHYYENFGVHTGALDTDDSPNAHGAIGKVIKSQLPNIIVEDTKDNIEKVIATSDDTRIEKGSSNINPSDILLNDFIIVVGMPNDQGIIDAKLIRVISNPEFLK